MNFYVGSVVGFRSWHIRDDRLYSSVIRDRFWPQKSMMVARCARDSNLCEGRHIPHDHSPHPDCSCGLYAWHDLSSALHNYVINSKAIVGAAVFWGKIEVHTQGFRAQFGRPLALVEDRKDKISKSRDLDFKQKLDRVRAEYDIPVLEMWDLKPYALEFGYQIGADMME